MNKTSIGLIEFAKKALNEKWYYVNGTYGQNITPYVLQATANRLTRTYTPEYIERTTRGRLDLEGNVFGKRGADCIGLIKAYMWWIDDSKNPDYVATQDKNVSQTWEICTKKGVIDLQNKIPEVIGLLVFKTGHVGIYIGNGKVIESKGASFGVVETNIEDTEWTGWAEYIYIDYNVEVPVLSVKPIRLLSFGSVGADVQWVKEKMKALNYNVGEINGNFDKVFDSAVRQLQDDNDIQVDGIVGKNTIKAIETPKIILTEPVPVVQSNPYPRPSFIKNIRIGTKSAEVGWIQYQLFKYGYLKSINDVDKNFGSGTQTAVISFQRNVGLNDDGIVGQNTNKALASLSNFKPITSVYSNPYPQPNVNKIYKVGIALEEVKWIKTVLIRNGYVFNDLNNEFTTALAEAVKSFQLKNGLLVDGKVGKNTIGMLQKFNK